MVRADNKHVKSLEKDLFKAAKAATKVGKSADISSIISGGGDKDEKVLRDKLVSKLKQKEIEKVKIHGDKLRDARDMSFYVSSSMEDISEDDLSVRNIKIVLNQSYLKVRSVSGSRPHCYKL